MKKTYQKPTMELMEAEVEQFMMMSVLGETDETSGNLGRESDFDWEDDDY